MRLKYVTNYSNKEFLTKSSTVPDWLWQYIVYDTMVRFDSSLASIQIHHSWYIDSLYTMNLR